MKLSDMHKYQLYASGFIVNNPKAFMIQDMGLGKTISTLTACQALYDEMMIRHILVIAPLRVAQNTWPDEIEKWEHINLDYQMVAGKPALLRKRLISLKPTITVINRENIAWLINWMPKKHWYWDVIVIDESSSFKSPSTKRFRALRKLAMYANRVVLLTGTPAPNSLLELWSQVFLLDQGQRLERSYAKFRSKYFRQADYMGYKWAPKRGAQQRIYHEIKDITVSMRSKDYLDLPELIVSPVRVTLPDKIMKQYKELEKEFVLELKDTEITVANAAVLYGKLQQICNGAVYHGEGEDRKVKHLHDVKLDALEEIIEAAQDDNILLAYNFVHDADRIMKKFKQAVHVKEKGAIKDWQKGAIKLLISHPQSAGHGLNLQMSGRRVVWFGPPWTPEYWDQFNARVYRQGQTRTSIITPILAKGTVDELVYHVLFEKREGQSALIKALLTKIDEA